MLWNSYFSGTLVTWNLQIYETFVFGTFWYFELHVSDVFDVLFFYHK